MQKQHIAIIGAGTAGLAAAITLARQGHHISIFEAVEHLSPVGAGLLLQPAGLAVFAHLGVLEHALSLGAVVTGLEGRLANQQLLVNSHYVQAEQGLYGLGIKLRNPMAVGFTSVLTEIYPHVASGNFERIRDIYRRSKVIIFLNCLLMEKFIQQDY